MPFSDTDKQRIAEAVCIRIESGEMVEAACKAEGITGTTWRTWTRDNADLLAMYARAKQEAADALAEQAVAIALGDEVNGKTYTDPQERRVAYDALRWLAGKRRPKDYGETRQVDVNQTVTLINPDERDARLAALLLKAGLPKLTATARLAEPDASEGQQEG